MKFKFIIVDLQEGSVSGTADERVAKEFSQSDEFFVIDAETGTWLMDESNSKEVREQETYKFSDSQGAVVLAKSWEDSDPENV